jgi:hypothetical protein
LQLHGPALDQLLKTAAPQSLQQSVAVARSSTWSAAQDCSPQSLQQSVAVARSSTWSAAQDCSPTVATTNTNSKKQSPTVSVYPLRYAIWRVVMLLKTLNFRFWHFYCGHSAILSTLYNGYSAILSTVNGYCAILPPYNRYCAILSTEYSVDIFQYCPQTIQWFWDCTIKTIALDWHNI